MGPGLEEGYDAELRRHQEVLRRVWGVRARDRVLDVGCGRGLTTREAARAAAGGSALGVDVSAVAVERARALSGGVGNVAFEHGDAQVHPFPPGHFDLVVSRFGTMFFADPVAAFANLGRALRPGGRLVMMVWQAGSRNEWDVVIRRALGLAGDDGGAFSLGEPAVVERILGAAGFGGVGFAEVDEPVFYGADVAAALAWARGFACTREALSRLDSAGEAAAVERLRAAMGAHLREEGVSLGSRAWIVTAHRG